VQRRPGKPSPSLGRYNRLMSRHTDPKDDAKLCFDVIVVGAGHVGCASALALAQSGLHVALVAGPHQDRGTGSWANEPWDRRVYAISPAARRFLHDIRVWGSLDPARIAPIRDMRIFERSPAAATLHFGAYEIGVDALAFIVEHRELTRVLDAAVGFQQRVERFAVDAEQVTSDEDGTRVVTARGELRAALVIGADGARSLVREQAGIASHGKSYEALGVVANFTIEPAHRGVANQWFTDEGVIALLPLPDHGVSLVWSAPRALGDALVAAGADEIGRRLASLAHGIFGSFVPLGGVSAFPLSMLRAKRQIAHRVALIGDAAHVVHPLAGQGLNLGFEDARALAFAVSERETHRDPGDAAVLRRYERARAEAVWAMGELTDRLLQVFRSDDSTLAHLRATGLNLVDRLPFVKRVLARHAMG
jgi:2-octaprenylphenol hydroxylase